MNEILILIFHYSNNENNNNNNKIIFEKYMYLETLYKKKNVANVYSFAF